MTHEHWSYELGVTIGLAGQATGRDVRYGLKHIVAALAGPDVDVPAWMASRPDVVARLVARLGGITQRHAGPALLGDPATFAPARDGRDRDADALEDSFDARAA